MSDRKPQVVLQGFGGGYVAHVKGTLAQGNVRDDPEKALGSLLLLYPDVLKVDLKITIPQEALPRETTPDTVPGQECLSGWEIESMGRGEEVKKERWRHLSSCAYCQGIMASLVVEHA